MRAHRVVYRGLGTTKKYHHFFSGLDAKVEIPPLGTTLPYGIF